jgi:hypothetical protein
MEYAGVRSGVVGATCAVAAPATGSTPSRGAGDATTRLPPPLNLYFTRYGRIFRAGGREGRGQDQEGALDNGPIKWNDQEINRRAT